MVDFQSRDTRRGPVTDDEDDGEEEEPDAPAETDQEGADETDTQPEADEQAAEPADPEATGGITAVEETDGESESESDSDPDPQFESASDSQSERPATETDATAPAEHAVEPTRTIDVAVVTVGEGSEHVVVEAFESAGHTISTRERLRGDYDGIQQAVDTLVGRDDVDAVVTTGGVGIDPDEMTIEAVHPLLEKALPGFGEAFRTLLYDAIGTGIVAVRSAAGVADGTLVFCLPGDAEAARLAVAEILVTEAPELVAHLDE